MVYQSEQEKYKQTAEFAVKNFREMDETKLEAIQDFLSWLEYEYAGENTTEKQDKDNFKKVEKLVNLYLGYDKEKIKQGEKLLLAKWKLSVNGES